MASEVKAWSKLYDMTKQSILKKRSTGEYFNQAEVNIFYFTFEESFHFINICI